MLELDTKFPWVYEYFVVHGYHTVRRTDRYWAGLWTDLIIKQVMMRSLKSRGGLTRGRGVTKSVRIMWINSMHRCAGIHDAMTTLTGLKLRTSEQHVELSTSRRLRDSSDLKKLAEWFEGHDPFDAKLTDLRSLSSGLTASEEDRINCDDAENVGQAIHIKLDGVCFENAKLKRSDQIQTLSRLQDGTKLNNLFTVIDPLVLFSRLTALVQRQEDIPSQFFYELTPEPTSLLKDGLMRKPTKSTLRNHLLKNVPSTTNIAKSCVVDGGALLHKVQWLPKCTYNELADHYVSFVKRKYGKHEHICVVFDGYDDILSTKT